MPDIALLVDDFGNGIIDDPPWSSGAGAAETGGGIVLPCVPAFAHVETTDQTRDLTGSAAFTELTTVPDPGVAVTAQAVWALRTGVGDAGSVRILWDNGALAGQYITTGGGFNDVFTVATFDPVANRWWRITEADVSGVRTVQFWTSADGIDWDLQGGVAVATLDFAVTALDVHYLCGQFGRPEESLGSARWEHINVSPLEDHDGGSTATVTVTAEGSGQISGEVLVDASSPARVTGDGDDVTTAAFNPPANAVLVACVGADAFAEEIVGAITNNGDPLSWTTIAERHGGDVGGNGGYAGAFWAALPGGRTGMTVTATTPDAFDPSLQLYVLTGADTTTPVGGTGEGSSATNNLTTTAITTTADAGGLGIVVGTDFANNGAPASADTTFSAFDGGSDGLSGYKPITTASTTFNLDSAGAATAAWNWVAFEILAAADEDEDHDGGSTATVTVTATGAGGAGQVEAGGSTATVTVAAEGAGTPALLAGTTAPVTAAAEGAGSPGLAGGTTATVTVTAEGGAGEAGTNFPSDPLPLNVELFYDGAWNDITDDVYHRDGVTAIEGRPDEATISEPSRLSLTLNNRDGRYSPRNPMSPLYGLIGRNTPIRLRIGQPALGNGLIMPGNSGSYVSAPWASGDDIDGDLDLRIELTFPEWPPADTGRGAMGLARRFSIVDVTSNAGWALVMTINPDVTGLAGDALGTLQLFWTTDGSVSTLVRRGSTAPISPTAGTPIALRATLDLDNDAGGHTVTWYTSDAIDGSWAQLGDAVTETGTTTLFASDADLEVGRTLSRASFGAFSEGVTTDAFYGRLRGMEVRDGIDGTLVNSLDLTEQTLLPGDREITSAQSDAWTVYGGACFTDTSILFSGEASSWPARWETTGTDVYVPIQASGIGRRLQQGVKPLASVLRRGIPDTAGTVAYWPCEEGRDATRLASAFDGHPSGSLFGDVTPGGYDGFRTSAPIPTYGEGGRLHLFTPGYAETDSQRLIALVHIPDTTFDEEVRLLALVTTGSITRWEILFETRPSENVALRIRAFDVTETLVVDDGFFNFAASDSWSDRNLLFSVRLTQDGDDVEYGFFGTDVDTGTATGSGTIGTAAGQTYGRIAKIYTAREGDDLGDTAIGQLVISAPDLNIWDAARHSLPILLSGLTGETAADRLDRLATEEGVPTVVQLGADTTEPMGGQTPDRLVELLQQTAASDMAVYGDARDQLAVSWRSRQSLYNQPAALTLDYAAGELASPFEPEEDDKNVRNDVTVERIDGSEHHAVATTGPLSTAPPPDGVGRYDESVSLSLGSDAQLEHQAAWRLHLGTVDQVRYPSVTVQVHRNPELMDQVNAVTVGDRIAITNLPSWLPPGGASLLVNRIERRMRNFAYYVTFTCSPADPWAAALAGLEEPGDAGPTDRARADTAGAQLADAIDTDDTTLTVATTVGPRWTTDAAHLPFDIVVGGEVMRVTAISGTSSPQTMTVTRSINGIVKSHANGAGVRLAYPAVAVL